MDLRIELAYDFPGEIRMLFDEYTDMIIAGDGSFKEYLEIQNYGEELEHLEMKYGFPNGRLYLAYWQGRLAGCIGLRKIDAENCEMKRLYVRPEFRGKRIGIQLVEKVIADAREIRYSYMLLDTLPFLQSAVRLYKQCGFYEIPSYNDSPMETAIYMRLDLQ
ncbi:GNAT family N-acetyltransferase [Lachnospiraceae bacterium 46-15]